MGNKELQPQLQLVPLLVSFLDSEERRFNIIARTLELYLHIPLFSERRNYLQTLLLERQGSVIMHSQ